MHKKFRKDWTMWFWKYACRQRDMQTCRPVQCSSQKEKKKHYTDYKTASYRWTYTTYVSWWEQQSAVVAEMMWVKLMRIQSQSPWQRLSPAFSLQRLPASLSCYLLLQARRHTALSTQQQQPPTTILRPYYRSTCVSWHLQVKIGGFCWCKVRMPACPCRRQPAHLDSGEDARVLSKLSPYLIIYTAN